MFQEEYKFIGGFGLGKGKPLTARKKMPFSLVKGFRSKYSGKAATIGLSYQKKNQKIADFGRKRCTKSKMRGIFGAPGLGLQVSPYMSALPAPFHIRVFFFNFYIYFAETISRSSK